MKRAGLLCVIVTALIAGACGSNEAPTPGPTAPTPTTPPPSTPAPPAPTPSCAPPPVTGLSVSFVPDSTRIFTWNASPGATSYDVQIRDESKNLIYTNTSQTTYTWKGIGVSEFVAYYARVHAKNQCGQANPSNEIVFH